MAAVNEQVRQVLADLRRAGADPIYLKNYSYLLEDTPYGERDIDLLIPAGAFDTAREVLIRHGFLPDRRSDVVVPFRAEDGPRWDVHVGALYLWGTPYLDHSALRRDARTIGGVLVPSQEHEFSLVMAGDLRRVLTAGRKTLPKERRSRLRELRKGLMDGGESLDPALSPLRRSLVRRLLSGRPLGRLWALLVFLRTSSFRRIGRAARRLTARGRIVAFVGTDGVGKSSTIEGVSEALRRRGRRAETEYMGYWASSLIGLQRVSSAPSVQRLSRRVHNGKRTRLLVLIREILFVVDMLLKYCLRLVPATIRSEYVLTDRYFYDLLMNPRRTRLLEWAARMYPAPDVLILLTADPRTIAARKGQHTAEQSESFQERYREILKGQYAPQTREISTEGEREDVVRTVLEHIL